MQAIFKALSVHARIEVEIFYPALRDATDADDPLDEADVEQSHVKELVAQLENSDPDEELFEARVKVLSEYVHHHVEEEEGTLFSKARNADIHLVALGEQLLSRKEELGAGDQSPDVAALAGTQEARKRSGQRATR